MNVKIYQVDAFTNRPFTGNPAAVCLLSEPPEERWAQAVAMEMNLSETAFLYQENNEYRLRWFTPAVEVDLCGHATLACAHILWEEKYLAPDQAAIFKTRSGILTASLQAGWIKLDFPAKPIREASPPPGLLKALGLNDVLFVGVHKADYLVEVASPAVVRNLNPDHGELKKLPVRGVIVTSRSENDKFDFISRFFVPGSGIDEDPVTGSAHCCLGPYWLEKLKKDSFSAYQASKRGGSLKIDVLNDRVHLAGQAVTIFKGELVY